MSFCAPVLLPSEVTVREFSAKMVLAVALAGEGVPSVVGDQQQILSLASEVKYPTVFFHKSAGSPGQWTKLREKGVRVVAQDEEAGITRKEFAHFYDFRPNLSRVCQVDQFFCWNGEEASFLKALHPGCSGQIMETGGLRSMFWGDAGRKFFATELEKLRKKYGDYVLFSTKFTRANNQRGTKHPDRHREEIERQQIESFFHGAQTIATQFGRNVVFRPHPNENLGMWQEKFKDIKNVHVVRDGNAIPWIHGATAVVQDGCTTGIEASASGVPTIALSAEPEEHGPSDHWLPNLVSTYCQDASNLAALIEDCIRAPLMNSKSSQVLERRIPGAGTLRPLRKMRAEILNNLDSISDNRAFMRFRSTGWSRAITHRAKMHLRNSPADKYALGKSPWIPPHVVQNQIERARKLLEIEVSPNVRLISPGVYEIF